jgi:hypothetical protein
VSTFVRTFHKSRAKKMADESKVYNLLRLPWLVSYFNCIFRQQVYKWLLSNKLSLLSSSFHHIWLKFITLIKSVKLGVALDLLNTPTSHFADSGFQYLPGDRASDWGLSRFSWTHQAYPNSTWREWEQHWQFSQVDHSSRDLNTDLPQYGVVVTQSWGPFLSVLLMRS